MSTARSIRALSVSIALAIAFTASGCTRDIPQEPSSSQAAVLMTQGNLDASRSMIFRL